MIIRSYKIPVLAVALCVLATATAAHADGIHGCQTEITNNLWRYLFVETFNSNDVVCYGPHKNYRLDPGETKTVKAHAQDQSHCKMVISVRNADRTTTVMCKNHRCGANHLTKTAGRKTSFEVNGAKDCPGLKGFD